MLKFCRDNKGSISIFLLIVITAMLFFSFMTFDIAKINLATATARNNTDLAGNAALTYYDAVLKDAYGLLANSKNLDELSKNVADYYLATMASNGVEFDQPTEVHKLISDLINSGDVGDNENMLRILEDELDFSISGVAYDDSVIIQPINESAISNPSVMKRQIVEYMKYRAPLSLAMGVLEKFKVLEDISNQAEAMSDKIEYEDALNRVQNSSDQVYEICNAYKNNLRIYKSGFAEKSNNQKNYIEYGACQENAVSGYINSRVSGDCTKVVLDSYNDLIEALVRLIPMKNCVDYGGNIYKNISIQAASPSNLSDMDGFKNAAEGNGFTGKIYSCLKMFDYYNEFKFTQSTSDAIYDIMIAAEPLYNGGVSTDAVSGGDNISENFGKFYRDFYKLFYNYKEEYNSLKNEEKKAYMDTYEACVEIDEVLNRIVGRPKIYFISLDPPEHDEESEGYLAQYVCELYNDANVKLNDFNACISELGSYTFYQWKMAEFMAGDRSPLDDLQQEISQAKTASDEWDKSIDNVKTSDYNASMRANYKVEAHNFDEIDCSTIQTVKSLFAVQAQKYGEAWNNLNYLYSKVITCDSLLFEHIEKSTYNYVAMPDCRFILNYKSGCHALLEKADELSRNDAYIISGKPYSSIVDKFNPENNAGKRPYISSLGEILMSYEKYSKELDNSTAYKAVYDIVAQLSEKNIIKYTRTEEGKQEKIDTGSQKETVSSEKKEEAEDQEDKLKEQKNKNEAEAENQKPKDNGSNNDMSEVVSIQLYSDYIKGKETAVLSDERKDDTENGLRGNGEDGSGGYDVGNMEADDEGNYDFSGVQNILSNVGETFGGILEAGRDNIYVAEYLTGMFSCMTTNKVDGNDEGAEASITGVEFSSEKNKHYRAELEYIIYGCKTEFGNKSVAVASISGIRFALNFIYSYTDSEITTFTSSTAATLGSFVPFSIPAIKTVLHIVISSAETAWDMVQLCKGNAVPLYKSKSTWVCKASNIIKNVADDIVDEAASSVVTLLSEEINDFVDGKSTELKNYVSKKTDDLKEMLKSKTTVPIQEFTMQTIANLRSYVDSSDIYVMAEEEIELAFGRITADIDSSLSLAVEGSIEQELLNQLKNIIVGNMENYKSKLLSIIKEGVEYPSEFLTNIEQKMNAVIGDIDKKIDGIFDNKIRDRINTAVTDAAKELKDYASDGLEMGKEKLLSALDEKVSSKISDRNMNINLGSGSMQNNGKVSASVSDYLTMTYKDYLYFFLIMGMLNETESELERAAQLMQCNIVHRGADGFEINECRTMFNVYSASKVKTSVLGRYADSNGFTMKNLANGYYEIEIRSFVGY